MTKDYKEESFLCGRNSGDWAKRSVLLIIVTKILVEHCSNVNLYMFKKNKYIK